MPGRTIAVVIVNYRTPELALRSLAAVGRERRHLPRLTAIVVDGGSGDDSAEILRDAISQPGLSEWVEFLPLDVNGGFGWANNQAMLRLFQQENEPDYVLLLNPDAEVEIGAISALADVLDEHPECAAAGSALVNEDGSPSGSAYRFPSIGREFVRASQTPVLGRLLGIKPLMIESAGGCEVEWVTGASVLFRSEALKQVGLFDDGFFLYYEEVELMWRVRQAGWSIRYAPASRVCHIGGAATKLELNKSKKQAAPMPAYWHASRQRFFALTRGRSHTIVANLASIAGQIIWKLRSALLPTSRSVPQGLLRGLLKEGLVPSQRALTPARIRWDSKVGTLPAWMDGEKA